MLLRDSGLNDINDAYSMGHTLRKVKLDFTSLTVDDINWNVNCAVWWSRLDGTFNFSRICIYKTLFGVIFVHLRTKDCCLLWFLFYNSEKLDVEINKTSLQIY